MEEGTCCSMGLQIVEMEEEALARMEEGPTCCSMGLQRRLPCRRRNFLSVGKEDADLDSDDHRSFAVIEGRPKVDGEHDTMEKPGDQMSFYLVKARGLEP